MSTLFDSPEARSIVEALYYQKLDGLNLSYERVKVETSFGDTHVILTGEKDNPPLVLLHGANGCAPIALEALKGLERTFRIYAIDIIGQPNLSASARLAMKDHAYGQWMYELLSRFGIRDAALVGISMGGFISWKTLVYDKKRIAQAYLIVPAGIVNGNSLTALWKVFLPIKLYQWRKKQSYVRDFLRELFTEEDDFALEFLSQVLLHVDQDFSPIPLISQQEAQQITTPLYIIGANQDILFPGEKMLRRAHQLFPSLKNTILLENSRHVPSAADNTQIVDLINQQYHGIVTQS
ncbi:MAG: alpha/beta hydrolase [Bacteroidota bacterium]